MMENDLTEDIDAIVNVQDDQEGGEENGSEVTCLLWSAKSNVNQGKIGRKGSSINHIDNPAFVNLLLYNLPFHHQMNRWNQTGRCEAMCPGITC